MAITGPFYLITLYSSILSVAHKNSPIYFEESNRAQVVLKIHLNAEIQS